MGLLLFAGGFTTSIEAGMAFLDWPLSNGSLNPEGWLHASDQLAEHSHRLLGMKMGLLSLALWGCCMVFESRKWVRRTAGLLVGIIVFQGILGGLRVLLDQQNIGLSSNGIARVFLILHACGAQLTLCTMVTLVVQLSKPWIDAGKTDAQSRSTIPTKLLFWSRLSVFALFLQLLLGAFIRHFKAATIFGDNYPLLTDHFIGLASLFPSFWSLHSVVHYLHRIWAVGVCVILLRFYVLTWAQPVLRKTLGFWLMTPTLLLALQVFLGALVVWTLRNPYAATVHTLTGASILAITWGLTLCLHHDSNERERHAG